MSEDAIIKRWEAENAAAENLRTLFSHKKSFWRSTPPKILDASHSPFGLTDEGLIDLRGFSIAPMFSIYKVHFINCDLSKANLCPAWIEDCVFENVRFDYADLSSIKDHGNSYTDCRFVTTSFGAAGIGYKGASYTNCRFEKANFTRSVYARAEFNQCEFINCRLKGIDFHASSFVNCVFEGKLDDVWFRGGLRHPSEEKRFGKARKNRMLNVSFEKASLWGITFSDDCDLSTIIPPASGNYRLYDSWKARLDNLQTIVESWPPSEEKRQAEIFLRAYMRHEDQDWYLINCDEIENWHGKEVGQQIIAILDSFDSATS